MSSEPGFPLETPAQLHLADRPEYIRAFQNLTLDERLAAGKAARSVAPRAIHGEWAPALDRLDPLDVLEAQNRRRLAAYLPIRYGRMLASPFAFLRGSVAVMALDLAGTPVSGITVQTCGDAHLANFGIFASAERNLIFGINDFDDTLPGPWEWDVKRLAASITVAGTYLGLGEATCRGATFSALRAYRKRMWDYAGMGYMELYYTRIDSDAVLAALPRDLREATEQTLASPRHRAHLQVLEKQSKLIDGDFRIIDDAPLVVHPPERSPDGRLFLQQVREWLHGYRSTLNDDRRALLDRYQVVDVALKVGGVASVGTRCYVVLLRGKDNADPLILQVKQAGPSVLEAHLQPSTYPSHGQRVVAGQRLIQAAPDIFLGWWTYRDINSGEEIDFYVRQLRDMKGSVDLEPGRWRAEGFMQYAGLCGWALALAHARSGDPAMIAGYLGDNSKFDEAVVKFATAYAEQTQRDHAALVKAASEGRIEAATRL